MFQINDRKNFPRSPGRWNPGFRIILSALIAGVVWLGIPATTAHGFEVCAKRCEVVCARQCAFGDLACGAASAACNAACVADVAACEVKIHAYHIYMDQMGLGVSKHQLPAVYRDILGPMYPQTNFNTFRFGFSDRQPPDNATTDCNTTYFNSAVQVDRLRNAAANPNYSWLLHEVTHTEQCTRAGGREAYAKRWWVEMEAAANAQGRKINFLQSPEDLAKQIGTLYFDSQVHDRMPMEQQATNKADGLLPGLRTCCIAQSGKPIRPMTVSGIDERSDAGTSRRILTARVANGDPPFTTRWWIKSPGDSGFIQQPQNLVNGLELLWTPKNDPAKAEVVKTIVQTTHRWRHDIEVEIAQQAAALEKRRATRTIVISERGSITSLDKGPKIQKLPAELPPSKIPKELLPIGPGTPKQPGGPIPPKPPFGP